MPEFKKPPEFQRLNLTVQMLVLLRELAKEQSPRLVFVGPFRGPKLSSFRSLSARGLVTDANQYGRRFGAVPQLKDIEGGLPPLEIEPSRYFALTEEGGSLARLSLEEAQIVSKAFPKILQTLWRLSNGFEISEDERAGLLERGFIQSNGRMRRLGQIALGVTIEKESK